MRNGAVEAGSEGDRKSTSAAIAPLEVLALVGIILGKGKGSVYGMRRRGIARGREFPLWHPWLVVSQQECRWRRSTARLALCHDVMLASSRTNPSRRVLDEM